MSNHAIAHYRDGAWVQITPRDGWRAFVCDAGVLKIYEPSTGWVHHADDRVAKTGDTMSGNLGVGTAPQGRLHTSGGEVYFDQAGEMFTYYRRTGAGGSNQYVANQQFCALNSDSAYKTYFKTVCQQLVHTAGSEAGFVAFESLTGGGVTSFLQYQGIEDRVSLHTGGTERLRVDAAGNLGVGTTAPGARLHVNGSARVDDSLEIVRSAGGAYLDFKDDAADDFDARVQLLSDGLSLFSGGNGSTAERVHVRATGSVRFVPLASAPAGVSAGDVYFDSTLGKLRCYDGSAWQNLF